MAGGSPLFNYLLFGQVGGGGAPAEPFIIDTFDDTVTAADEGLYTVTNGRLTDSGHSWVQPLDLVLAEPTVLDATDELSLPVMRGSLIGEAPASLPTRLTGEFKHNTTDKNNTIGFIIRSNNAATPTYSTSYSCVTTASAPNITVGIHLRNGLNSGIGTQVAVTTKALTGDTLAYRECEVTDDGSTITFTDPLEVGLTVSLSTTTYNTQKMVGIIGTTSKVNNFKVYE